MVENEYTADGEYPVRPSRLAQKREDRERDRRIKILTVILLLLLLLLLAVVFAYVLVYGPIVRRILRAPALDNLFSIYGFDRPLSVSTDERSNIYVSDTGNGRLLIFDANGNYVKRIGTSKMPNRLYGVYTSRVDSRAQKIYIADWSLRAINVFSLKGARGKFLYRFPKSPLDPTFGRLGFSPFGIDTYKGKLYVTSNDGIYIFTKKGKLLEHWGARGKEIGNFDYPTGIAVDKRDGSVYVADQLNRRFVALTRTGKVRWLVGQPDQNGEIVSFFGLPRGVAIDSNRRIFVSDTFHHQLMVFDRHGRLITALGSRGVDDGKFNFPEGFVFTRDGVIYIADRENNRVQVIRVNKFPEPSPKLKSEYRRFFYRARG